MKRHIDFIKEMINTVDSSIKFYEVIPPVDISKLMEENTICCIVKRVDDNLIDGDTIKTKFTYTINIISRDITKDILSTQDEQGLIRKCLNYLATNIPMEWDCLLRAGQSGIDTQFVSYGFYVLFLNITFEDEIDVIL